MDAAHAGGGQIDLIGLFGGEECLHRTLIRQVQLGVATREDGSIRHALRTQRTHDGATHHAAVAGNVDSGRGHHSVLSCQGSIARTGRS